MMLLALLLVEVLSSNGVAFVLRPDVVNGVRAVLD